MHLFLCCIWGTCLRSWSMVLGSASFPFLTSCCFASCLESDGRRHHICVQFSFTHLCIYAVLYCMYFLCLSPKCLQNHVCLNLSGISWWICYFKLADFYNQYIHSEKYINTYHDNQMSFLRHRMSAGVWRLHKLFVYKAPWRHSIRCRQQTSFPTVYLWTSDKTDALALNMCHCEKVKAGLDSYETWRLHVCLEKKSSRMRCLWQVGRRTRGHLFFNLLKKRNSLRNRKSQKKQTDFMFDVWFPQCYSVLSCP